MSHSPRGANARIACRGAGVKCLTSRKMLGTASTAATRNVSALRSALEKQSIEQQQDHRADDRHDPAGDVILAPEDATNPRANERACDAEQNRHDAPAGISARH
jgi:hypothetical protein